MSKTSELRERRDCSPEQLMALYSAGELAHGGYELFDLYTSQKARELLARYLPAWMDRGDIQWSYMGYSFDSDRFVVGFSGASQQGDDVDGYYLFKIENDEISFQGLGLARGVTVYGELIQGLRAMYPDLVDLQLD